MFIISYLDHKTNLIKTRYTDSLTENNISRFKAKIGEIEYLYEEALKILNTDISRRYITEYKRKKNGTFRRIDKPDDKLKKYMKEVVTCFVEKLNFLFPEYVRAYVKHRSNKETVLRHTNSYAIAKFDISNFFGSCTLENIMLSLERIYPFCLIDSLKLETILKACMIYYDGHYRLPQGAPSSPLLSNLTMLPIDVAIDSYRRSIIYSRYSDDLFFSFDFRANKITFKKLYNTIISEFGLYDFKLNNQKTRFLKTKQGNVWILGISVGNDLKIGSKKKQYIKAQIWTFLNDYKDGKIWPLEDVYHLRGVISYYGYIEPDFINSTIAKYEKKSGIIFNESIKNIL